MPRASSGEADAGMLSGYVVGLSLLETANIEQAKIDAGNRHPLMVIGHRGTLIPSPYLRVIRLASEMVARFGAELGMSPSARSTLSVDETLPEPDKDWTRFDALLKKRPIKADPIAEGIDYAKRVVARKIPACKFVRLAAQRFLDDLKAAEAGQRPLALRS